MTKTAKLIKKYQSAFFLLWTCLMVLTGAALSRSTEVKKAWAWEYPRVSYLPYEKAVEVEKYIFVSKKTETCIKNHPEIVKKIKLYFGDEWLDATELYCRESSLNPQAINPSSGACGLVQALPCSKLNCSLDDLDCQLAWGKKYIENRYQSARKAVEYHNRMNWY